MPKRSFAAAQDDRQLVAVESITGLWEVIHLQTLSASSQESVLRCIENNVMLNEVKHLNVLLRDFSEMCKG